MGYMKHFEFEYGQGTLGADLPDTTDVFIPGETVAYAEGFGTCT